MLLQLEYPGQQTQQHVRRNVFADALVHGLSGQLNGGAKVRALPQATVRVHQALAKLTDVQQGASACCVRLQVARTCGIYKKFRSV